MRTHILRPAAAVLAALVALALFGAAAAQTDDEGRPLWFAQLERDAMAAENCKILYITSPREYDLLGKHIVEARIQCDDSRAFDATKKDDGPFTFAACEPVAC